MKIEGQVVVVNLKKLCRLKGLTVKGLARLAQVNYQVLNRRANGIGVYSLEMYNKVKKYL